MVGMKKIKWRHCVKGSLQIEMSQKVEKVQKGGGSVPEIKKSTIQNVAFW